MESPIVDTDLRVISRLVADMFAVTAVHKQGDRYVLSLSAFSHSNRAISLLKERLKTAGYTYSVTEQNELILLTIDPKPKNAIPRLNILLFILTLLSVYIVPVFFSNLSDGLTQAVQLLLPPQITSITIAERITLIMTGLEFTWFRTVADLATGKGIEFTIAMMSILLVHEMGHYVAGRRRHIITSWPYFIPAPNIIGTFGAVIKSKSPFWNRNDLLEVGAAGPIAGWIIAIGWLLYGLSHSVIVPESAVSPGQTVFFLDGESLLMKFLAPHIVGTLSPGCCYLLTESAFAGWVGLLVTSINMLPMGQLDGGHILYGLSRKNQHVLGHIVLIGLFLLGFFTPTWWIFGAMGLFFGVQHPPTLDDKRKPGPVALAMGIVALIILLISFTPIPFQ